jgi:apolipoprotein N-acyltransferase
MVDGSAKGMPPPDAVEQVDRDEPEAAVFDAVIVTGPLVRLAAALVAGLLLCASFPLLDWWWAAVVAFALLGWVLTRPATTVAGGLGYGVLFGLAFYLPLLRWISDFVGVRDPDAAIPLCAPKCVEGRG